MSIGLRRLLRDLVSWGVVLVALVAVGLFAWATHHPDSPALIAAESWPALGGWVVRFRAWYSPPEVPDPGLHVAAGGRDAASSGDAPPPGATPGPLPPRDLRAPLSSSDPPVARSRGGDAGWAGSEPPLGRATIPPRPLPGRAADPAVLALALELLGISAPAGTLGPYPLYTDAPRAGLFALDRVVAEVEPAYRARYGRRPVGAAREAVVLFSRREDYRRFQVASDDKLVGLPAVGHTIGGVVAAHAEGHGPAELAETLIHEVVHLLNRRALGPALPPWLDEGIADDLAGSHVDVGGTLSPGRIGGSVIEHAGRREIRGAHAALRQLDGAFAGGAAVPLARLTSMDWEEFVRSEARQLHYAEAGFFVRYLVDGGDPQLAAAFRRFLAGVSEGGPVDGEALRRETGRPWHELEGGLTAWVGEQVSAMEPPPPARSR
ncbi:MAG TPA: hypothetical protein VM617_00485 [Thermoanaerobaculia bacterium]|nr:hypothetical protein [Thermoanaerobaculia bacterium]